MKGKCDGYQPQCIMPNMHIMAFHIPIESTLRSLTPAVKVSHILTLIFIYMSVYGSLGVEKRIWTPKEHDILVPIIERITQRICRSAINK